MLLRSSSTPILKSWIPNSKESSPEHDNFLHIRMTRSFSLTASSNLSSHGDDSTKKINRALSEDDMRELPVAKRKPFHRSLSGHVEEGEEREVGLNSRSSSLYGLFLSSGLDGLVEGTGMDEGCIVGSQEEGLETLVMGDGAGTNGGFGICSFGGGGSNRDDGDGGSGLSGSENAKDRTDAYYRKMIEANPGNSLVLGNYARFLKEILGDLAMAEEYCGRAILANPNDGNVLSLFADLIWLNHKDGPRAESYFDQAVKAAPDDCYVQASYARFLWDAEEEPEEEEQGMKTNFTTTTTNISQINFFRGADLPPPPPPLAAAS